MEVPTATLLITEKKEDWLNILHHNCSVNQHVVIKHEVEIIISDIYTMPKEK